MLRDNCMSTHLLSESKAQMLAITSTLPASTSLDPQQSKKSSVEYGRPEHAFIIISIAFMGKLCDSKKLKKKKNSWTTPKILQGE